MSSIDELLVGSALPRSEARLLLTHALRAQRAWIAGHGRDELEQCDARAAQELFARRRDGEPIAYLTGEREFYSLSLQVTPAVLIPRQETELVVERSLALLAGRSAPRVLDMGTGSGAIAVALAYARTDAEVWAADAAEAALDIAAANARRHGVSVRFVHSDWFAALRGERYDLIACNPPYVADGDPHLRAGDLRFEPPSALLGGRDGMACIRTVAAAACDQLSPGGWLVLEHGCDQGSACVGLLRELGYAAVTDRSDLAGLPRVCEGRFDAPPKQS